ncbi:replication-relaxation family protein [Catenulispora pinisilvae]|uniref:replication-relaxation family protein n=1 Tax=Catenulispora pinisilvae TaxID=2705253 RepID=UPI00189142F4|nr:replication-relaxation family protein [Catenulispora pinisilvae]
MALDPRHIPQHPNYLQKVIVNTPAPGPRRAALADLAARLTARDRWLLHALREHQVLTGPQIARIAYTNIRTANLRLALLTNDMRVIERFRPLRISGSAPEHYVLGAYGAQVLAAEAGVTIKQLGYHRSRTLGIAHSPRLRHTVGVNELYSHFAAASAPANDPVGALSAWWSELTCFHLYGDLARPDAFGSWQAPDPRGGVRSTEFFLEYDTGTENLERLLGKLDGYARLAQVTGTDTPVLFWLQSPLRERALHRLLALNPPAVPVATATPESCRESGITGPIWDLAARRTSRRLHLIELAAYTRGTRHTDHDPDADRTGRLFAPPQPRPPASRTGGGGSEAHG